MLRIDQSEKGKAFMSLDADAIMDRRRLRRKVTFWRVIAFVVAIFAILSVVIWVGDFDQMSKRADHVARVPITGVIMNDRDRLGMIDDLIKSDRVKGVVLDIDSPGGSTVGGEALYQKLRELAEEKPVVATIGTLGASAGYMTAISADHVVARYTSLTGAIGVYIQFGNIKGLLDTIGVDVEVVRSGPLKAEPNFFDETPAAARANLQDAIDDSYDWFVDKVATRREMDEASLAQARQGGIFTGERARKLGLVDEIGGIKVARDWLAESHDVSRDLPLVTWTPSENIEGLSFSASLAHAAGAGFADALAASLGGAKALVGEGVTLDGLVSVWHAQGAAEESNSSGGHE